MTLRLGMRPGSGSTDAVARAVIAAAAQRARTIFEELGRSWAAATASGRSTIAAAAPELDG